MKLLPGLLFATLTLGLPMLPGIAAAAGTVKTDAAKMTLYTFDKDKDGVPSCYQDCAKNWPPYLGKSSEKMGTGWKLVERTDKTMQWAYDGKPTYLFSGDKKPGDMTGDGKGGMWHALKE
ncbi:COG4315 family predicted lipoprotein [Paracoccus aminophilus]|uniref:Lipoprotein n=1 Tax=Paracoccus aminophilus JCM 7686 TaxID=1367847 RepID=S5YPR7_PARAH|nr:hypothetical protein [Paracoccus aminophilus]AGT07301.1 hypothetical protein JCM7686_0190 [Paracoccus aminophilus JCM 7686]